MSNFVMSADEGRKNPYLLGATRKILGDLDTADLYAGDFAALDTPLTVGIERKTIGNLVGSLSSGELDDQLTRLVSTYDIPIILVEEWPCPTAGGTFRLHGAGKSFHYSWPLSSLATWFARGVWPLFLPGGAATPLTVAALFRTFQKEEHRVYYAPRKVLPNLRRMPLAFRALTQFPGMGEKRARGVAAGKSMRELAAATEDQWKEWLGPTLGPRVYAAWDERGTA